MKSRIIMIFLSILTLNSLYAHPHIYIDYKLEIIENNRADIYWTFDPLESEKNIYYFDNNSDGLLDKQEQDILFNEGFNRISEYNYFLIIKLNEQLIRIEKVENFQAVIEKNGQLSYSFEIDLPPIKDNERLSIAHFDTTYFVSFGEPDRNDVELNNDLYSIIIKNLSTPYYYDPGAGRDVVLDTSKEKAGWVKAYPTEVLISREPIINSYGEYKITIKEKMIQLQRVVYLKLSGYLVDIKNGKSRLSILIILLMAFIYGVIHALGPGHRKVVLSSYFLSYQTGKLKALGLSFLSALIHSGSGIIIVIALNFIYQKIREDIVRDISVSLESTGYYSLLVLTIILIVMKLSKKNKNKRNSHKIGLSMIILTSLLPCPGAITIMLFSLSMNMLGVGIITVISMSLGIGFSLSVISVLTIMGKGLLKNLPERRLKAVQRSIEWTGLALLLIFSLFMIIFQL